MVGSAMWRRHTLRSAGWQLAFASEVPELRRLSRAHPPGVRGLCVSPTLPSNDVGRSIDHAAATHVVVNQVFDHVAKPCRLAMPSTVPFSLVPDGVTGEAIHTVAAGEPVTQLVRVCWTSPAWPANGQARPGTAMSPAIKHVGNNVGNHIINHGMSSARWPGGVT